MHLWSHIWCVVAHRDHHRLLSDEVERFARLNTVLVICEHCGCVHRRWARGIASRIMRGDDMAGFSLQDEERIDGRPEGIWTPYGPELTAEEEQINVRRAAEGKPLLKREAFKIRPLYQKDMDHFRKMAVPKNKWVNNQRVTDPDPDEQNKYLYDYLTEDWEGIYEDDAHEIPAECTLDNKLKLASKGLDRPNFIVTQASRYANDDEERKAAQRDNFRARHSAPVGPSESGLPSLPAAV
jgi:hypothetical protein